MSEIRPRPRRRSGEDRISSLPDELLHDILIRLRCARAAARTSVLSRRWRHVWAHLPELLLDGGGPSFLGAVDGALAGYSAPTLDCLSISLSPDQDLRIPVQRIQPWLRFASERVVGALCISLITSSIRYVACLTYNEEIKTAVLELPVWEGVTKIDLRIKATWRLRPPSAGFFAALTSLTIKGGRMGGGDLTALVCTQCPRLRDLTLSVTLAAATEVSLCSDSLHTLRLDITNAGRLDVVAPRLEELTATLATEAHISAPNLANLAWSVFAYDPDRHNFVDVGRRLRLLNIGHHSVDTPLIRRFDEVDELQLDIHIPKGRTGYQSFLNETNKLPKCNTLRTVLWWDYHDLMPFMFHLFRSCSTIRKFSVKIIDLKSSKYKCSPSCPCRLEESRNIDDVILSSLEEVEINNFTYSQEKLEFLEFLRCNAEMLKKLVINYTKFSAPPLTKEICEKVCSMCGPNVIVEFYVFTDGKWVCFG